MLLQLLTLGPCQPENPLARKGTKFNAPRMEAGGTGSHGPFFRRSSMSTCPKCSGLLVAAPSPLHLLSDYFIDTYDLQDPQGAAVKCLICGWYADPITIMNKAKQADAQRLVAQAEGWAMTHSVNTRGGQHHASTEKLEVCGPQDA